MDNQSHTTELDSKNNASKIESSSKVNKESIAQDNSNKLESVSNVKKEPKLQNKSELDSKIKADKPPIPKKPVKPPKLEDKPFDEFISKHLIPGLKSSIEEMGTTVNEIKLIEGERPVVGGYCWMVYCEMIEQRKFWLCFNKNLITSDKTILLAESNSEPSIVESFLIDEKKSTLPLLISRVLQRLNGQKWLGVN